jgi:hypothetical protein
MRSKNVRHRPFDLKERPEPPLRQDVYNAILSCSATSENLSDSIWVLLRLLSREIVKFPIEQPDQSEQTIPFWTGFNQIESDKFSLVAEQDSMAL